MSDVLIQNNDERDYIGRYIESSAVKGQTTPNLGIVTLYAGKVTRVQSDIWNVVIRVNGGINTIAEKIAQGRCEVIGGGDVSDEIKDKVNSKELSYKEFLHVYKSFRDMGGSDNVSIQPHVDKDGIPSFEAARLNLGSDSIDGDVHAVFAQRLRTELRSGMHSKNIIIPGVNEMIEAVNTKASANPNQVDEDAPPAPTYEELADKFNSDYDKFEEADGFGQDGKPKVGKLREFGYQLNSEQRDALWTKYNELYVIDEDEDEEGEE